MSAKKKRDHDLQSLNQDNPKIYMHPSGIRDRSRALASAAYSASDEDVLRIANQAFDVAQEGRDSYQRVVSAAGPLALLLERGKKAEASKNLVALLAEANRIEPPPSKVEALLLLWRIIWQEPSLRQPTQTMLLDACETSNTWRAGRAACCVVYALASKSLPEAEAILKTMPDSQYKRHARRMLDAIQP